MSALGVHFALTKEQYDHLLALPDDAARLNYVKEDIEDAWDTEFLQVTDHAWDAIHRCLSDWPPNTPYFYPLPGVDPAPGVYALPEDHGTYPLKLCILGGRKLHDDESTYFIRLIEPNEVADLAAALKPIEKAWMREKYFTHCEGAWPEYGEEDFEYTWEYFELVRDFFQRIAPTGRAVIFTADQ